MVKISAVEFQRNIGRYQDQALSEPVVVTRNGRERVVMLSIDEFRRLMRRDRQVRHISELDQQFLADLEAAEYPDDKDQTDIYVDQ